jgi:PAS domain S-box-containing protein
MIRAPSDAELSDALRVVSETVLDAVVIINGSGEVLAWNGVAEQIFGWSAREVLGRNMTEIIVPPHHRQGHREGMLRYQTTGEARVLNRRIEIEALHKNGREFPIELSITTAPATDGVVFIGFMRDISARRQAEAALRQARADAELASTERTAILSQLAEGVIVADAAGRITFVNDAAGRLHGMVKLHVGPQDYTDAYQLLTEDGRPYPSEELPLARAVRGETVRDAKWRIRRPDGTEVLALGTAQPLIGPSGEQTGAVLTARDVTERDRAERAVQESEARLRTLTDNLPGGAVYQIAIGPNGEDRRFLFLSQSYERLAGHPVEAVLRDPAIAYNAIHPEDLPQLAEAERKAIQDKSHFDVQVRFRRSDGGTFWCRMVSAPREQPDGSTIWDGLLIDVTARIEAQQALRELNETLEQRVAELVEERERVWTVSKDLFVICGLDGWYREANPAWAEQLGYEPSTLVGTRFDALGHPDDLELVQDAFQRLVAGAVVENLDLRLRAADGSYHWFSWTCVPAGDQLYAAGRNIDERKRLEDQLRQSQKMEAVGQLTGGIAHDFNNLLTIIRSAVDLMRRRDLPEERRRRYVDAISDTVDRASNLTNQLLAFARRQPLKPQVFEVGQQVRSVADLVRPILGSRIGLEVQIDDRARFVKVDVTQFETALVNLAVNARDAMQGQGTVAVRVDDADAIPALRGDAARRGQFVRITVADTGEGISPDHVDQIFEPFFTTKEVGRGTGLGLSQVYGFVQQSGGNIAVRSAAGEGSEFTLYLPRCDTPAAAAAEPADEISVASTTRAHVLVVEDNEEVGQFSTETLNDLGYATTWVSSADAALTTLAGNDLGFDVVFTDVIMPGMNGVELAQTIRERHPGLPVVLTSGYSEVLASEGTHGFELLKKPYSVEALSRMLRKAIKSQADEILPPVGQ